MSWFISRSRNPIRRTIEAAFAIAAMPVMALGQSSPAPIAAPESDAIDTSTMVRNVNTPEPTPWRPSQAEQEAPLDLVVRYRSFLRSGAWTDAYALLGPGLKALLSLAESVEMDSQRGWYRGQMSITRMSWYPEPAGAPPGLYVAMDFAARGADGSFHCGYIMTHRAAEGGPFQISRVDSVQFEAATLDNADFAAILSQMPCWLGDSIPTALNSGN